MSFTVLWIKIFRWFIKNSCHSQTSQTSCWQRGWCPVTMSPRWTHKVMSSHVGSSIPERRRGRGSNPDTNVVPFPFRCPEKWGWTGYNVYLYWFSCSRTKGVDRRRPSHLRDGIHGPGVVRDGVQRTSCLQIVILVSLLVFDGVRGSLVGITSLTIRSSSSIHRDGGRRRTIESSWRLIYTMDFFFSHTDLS